MSHTSTRLAIPIADVTDAADVPASIAALVAAIDSIMAVISKGTFASRPAAGTVAGKLYYATDTGAFYVTDGTTWQLVNPYPASDQAAGVASLRTLGATGIQAAAGNDSRLSDARNPLAGSVVAASIAAGAVSFAKMGFTHPLLLQKVGYNGSGFTAGGTNAKAGRTLGATDFTTLLGMSAPKMLFPAAGNFTDASGAGVTLTNNGSVTVTGTDASGIDGVTGTAFLFDGSTMYLTAPNGLKQKYGTWGCWVQTHQRFLPSPADQTIMAMWQAASSDVSMRMMIDGTFGTLRCEVSTAGGVLTGALSRSHTVIADGQWHFVAMSWDGAKLCVYVDGVLESAETVTLSVSNPVGQGPLNQSAALLLGIGAYGNGTNKFEGKISNIYVTNDALNEVAHRSLYAKKIAHGLGTQPQLYAVNVRKAFRSKAYVISDFTGQSSLGTGIAQPLMGSWMQSTTWVNDLGSLANSWASSIADANVPMPFQGEALSPLGFPGAFYLSGGAGFAARGSDTGLPSGASPTLSYGIWFRCDRPQAIAQVLWEYGTAAGNAGRSCWIAADGKLWAGVSGQSLTGAVSSQSSVCDGEWHFVVIVERNTGISLRKMYLDGQLISGATAALGTVTLSGALGACVGNNLANNLPLIGSMGGFFIGSSVLMPENVRELFCKLGSPILADKQPMDPMNCVERADITNIYWIGDDLEPTDFVELYAA